MGRRADGPAPEILHCDEHLVVIDKPPGVLSVSGRGEAPSAVDLLRDWPEYSATEPLRVVHRLDKDASGVLVYARTRAAQQHLVDQFVQRRVEKLYYALVAGYVERDGRIDLPLYFNKHSNRVDASPHARARSTTGRRNLRGKPAVTHYRVMQRLAGHTWLECRPETGRTHQIRAHLAAIGHPLSVDPLYGGGQAILLSHYKPGYHPSRRRAERPLISRLTLHAARIGFEHPATMQPVGFESPLPKDLRATLRQLGRLC